MKNSIVLFLPLLVLLAFICVQLASGASFNLENNRFKSKHATISNGTNIKFSDDKKSKDRQQFGLKLAKIELSSSKSFVVNKTKPAEKKEKKKQTSGLLSASSESVDEFASFGVSNNDQSSKKQDDGDDFADSKSFMNDFFDSADHLNEKSSKSKDKESCANSNDSIDKNLAGIEKSVGLEAKSAEASQGQNEASADEQSEQGDEQQQQQGARDNYEAAEGESINDDKSSDKQPAANQSDRDDKAVAAKKSQLNTATTKKPEKIVPKTAAVATTKPAVVAQTPVDKDEQKINVNAQLKIRHPKLELHQHKHFENHAHISLHKPAHQPDTHKQEDEFVAGALNVIDGDHSEGHHGHHRHEFTARQLHNGHEHWTPIAPSLAHNLHSNGHELVNHNNRLEAAGHHEIEHHDDGHHEIQPHEELHTFHQPIEALDQRQQSSGEEHREVHHSHEEQHYGHHPFGGHAQPIEIDDFSALEETGKHSSELHGGSENIELLNHPNGLGLSPISHGGTMGAYSTKVNTKVQPTKRQQLNLKASMTAKNETTLSQDTSTSTTKAPTTQAKKSLAPKRFAFKLIPAN